MFDVTNFVMRWLFLCNLIRDVAEIQTLPYNPQPPPPIQQVQEAATSPVSCEEEWKDNCLRGILSYPPGSHRVLVMDALRSELVQKLHRSLRDADRTLKYYEQHRRRLSDTNNKALASSSIADLEEDPYLDADLEILRAFEEATLTNTTSSHDRDGNDHRRALLVIRNNGTIDAAEDASNNSQSSIQSYTSLLDEDIGPMPSAEEVRDAQRTIRHVRDYLPQLVSIVLKSPQAFDQNLLDPVEKLRRLIIQRCLADANWGIDLCWLLEAEVGRAWKNLFEHRQQTGKRLIVVLPAEKAAVLAKIGHEKKEAFDFLQDAEQATAYGYTVSMDEELKYHRHLQEMHSGVHQPPAHHTQQTYTDDFGHPPARLPSSLSLRRCSHFGDTMHFIDRLTKISLDLRHVPVVHRHVFLHDNLREMNRRLRRRMATQADVSLDVEDNRGPDDWPHLHDITADMLRYSVHLPLEPSSRSRWPGSEATPRGESVDNGGVVRVLNIVTDESRILSSRERCPYLIHVEVADTGLRGNDGRLFAAGRHGLGATLEESLAMSATALSSRAERGSKASSQSFAPYQIPGELLLTETLHPQPNPSSQRVQSQNSEEFTLPRGGSQGEEAMSYDQTWDGMYYADPYDMVRQNELEQLHQQMYSGNDARPPPPPPQQVTHSIKEALLGQVFGQPWADKCEEIRQASPFGEVKGWRLASFIMKAGEDIRQEALAMQIIQKLDEWFQSDIPESHRPHLRPYTIMCVGGDAGVVECLSDAKSIDELKKRTDGFDSLRGYFERAYGPPRTHHHAPNVDGGLSFEDAQDNFLRSLVGYSLVCYILQIKDRHNANILLTRDGSLIHIDFGYLLGETPKMGKVPIFSERAPFKLSQEFWDVLGGWNIESGGLGVRFCGMFEQAFECAATHSEEISSLVEAGMLTLTQNPRVAAAHANGVRSRLRMRGLPQSKEQKMFVMELVNAALTSWGTSTYDWLQKNMNGYQ